MKRKLIGLIAAFALPLLAFAQNPPLMGWSSWNTYGFQINDSVIKAQADAMVKLGFKECGYNHINIDDGFFGGRYEDGKLKIHPERFPNGLRPLVDSIHSKGLKAGIYSDAGRNTCASYWGKPQDTIGIGVGLYGHDEQDMALFFNELDFDFIKVDYCGADPGNNAEGLNLDVEDRYKEIAAAIKATGRPNVTWNICRWAFPGTWACEIADSWRTTEDIFLGWESVKSIINQSLYLSAYTTYGHYNDMDMLEVGRGLTEEEDKTHFGMWCIMSSPLLIGCDMNDIKGNALELMQNKELIALNQNNLGLQAYVVKRENGGYVLVKDVDKKYGTTRAVAFYNPTDAAINMSIDFSKVDLAGEVIVRDLFEKKNIGVFEDSYSVSVPAHGTRIYKFTAEERLERTLYEAETAWLSAYQEIKNHEVEGTAVYSEKGVCSGGVAVGWLGNNATNDLQWRNVYSAQGGEYKLRVYFVTGDNRTMKLSVNGGEALEFTGNSGGWNTVGYTEFDVVLEKGENVIRLFNESGWIADIDRMELINKNAATEDGDNYYPIIIDKNQDYTLNRRLNSVSLGAQVVQLPTPLKVYSRIDDTCFTAVAGETLTPSFGYSGNWMNGFVYLDRGQDGAFDAALNSDGSFDEGSDIMAFSYAEPTPGTGPGYNSNGVTVSNANVLNPPSFTLPADIAPGFYLMRFKVDWASIDPAGRPEDGNGIIKNGGAICDVRLNVHGSTHSLSATAKNGALYAADGSQLPAEVAFARELKVKYVPADGYALDAFIVRHGHNLQGEQYICGVMQYDEIIIPAYTIEGDVVTIPAKYIDGDVAIEAVFAEKGADTAGGYALSFDQEAAPEVPVAGTIELRAGSYTYDYSLSQDNAYKMYTEFNTVGAAPGDKMMVNVEGASEGLCYYMYIDYNNDGKFSVLFNEEGTPAYSSELVSFTAHNGKNSKGEVVEGAGSTMLPAFKLPATIKNGVYRARVKADVNNASSAGSDKILSQGGFVADFLIGVLEGEAILDLNTINGSIIAPNNSALPVTVPANSLLSLELLPGAPGFEAKEIVVRHGHNLDGEQYDANGNRQWIELVIDMKGKTSTVLSGLGIDGDTRISANFEKSETGEWDVVFADEFNAPDGTQPSAEWWSRCLRQGATWNRWLSDSEEVVYIKDGKLVTRAIPNPDTTTDNVPMITGGIWSRDKFGFTYGRVEGRIKTHGWTGNFPAFWMMPEDQSLGWPNDGEIDIWEVIDAAEYAYHTVHSHWTWDLGNKNNPQSSFNEYTALDRYHTFTLDWSEDALVWFVDGKKVGEYKKSTSADALSKGQWPFDDHFHLILNQSVGNGSWAANADVTHTYETLFDWVRVYQKKGMANTVDVAEIVAGNNISFAAFDGGISVSVKTPAVVAVYDLAGRKVTEAFVSDSHAFSLSAGVYIINNSKIIVK